MHALIFCLLAILTFTLSVVPPAQAERRLALVVGNATYKLAGNLTNPGADATAMARMLRGLGFEVIEGIDLDRAGMQSAISDFGKRLNGVDIALFFYAGHGIQVDGENLLIPTDAEIETESDLALATVPLTVIQQQMANATRIKLIMLDACRDNPFHDQLKRALPATRALSSPDGLAAVSLRDDVGGTLIAFATDPGAYALDGHGQAHSPFTQALLTHMPRPGVELHEMMIDVRGDVWRATQESQRPWSNSSLTGKVYLGPEAPDTTVGLGAAAVELALWEAAEKGDSPAAYHAYLDAYPNGAFAGLAELRLGAILDPADPLELATTAPLSAPPMRLSETTFQTEKPFSETEAQLDQPAGKSDAQRGEEALALGTDQRVAIQRNLQRLGFRVGAADGIFGPRSRAAIRSWQGSAGLDQTGYLQGPQIARIERETTTVRVARLEEKPASPPRRRVQITPRAPADGNLFDQALNEIGQNIRSSASSPADPAVEKLLRVQRQDQHRR